MTVVTPDGRFEWDDGKAILNLAKHGVSFEEATGVFRDPYAIDLLDARHSIEEDRVVTIGKIGRRIVVSVIHTDRRGRKRVISARPATSWERDLYGNAR